MADVDVQFENKVPLTSRYWYYVSPQASCKTKTNLKNDMAKKTFGFRIINRLVIKHLLLKRMLGKFCADMVDTLCDQCLLYATLKNWLETLKKGKLSVKMSSALEDQSLGPVSKTLIVVQCICMLHLAAVSSAFFKLSESFCWCDKNVIPSLSSKDYRAIQRAEPCWLSFRFLGLRWNNFARFFRIG